MMLRIVLGLLAIAVAFAFEQTPAPVKAGDLAPNLVWTRILAGGEPGSFFGRVTVIAFFPAVSPNESLVSKRNELVAKFAGQPVQFVWIAAEYQPPLDPWLEKHPVSGCLLLDPLGATAQAYGVEFGGAIVNSEGRIAGFTFVEPGEEQIKAVQEGRSIAIKGDADDSQLDAILAGRAVRLDSEPHRMRMAVPEGKPDIPPSLEVGISLSKTNGTEENQGPDWWVQRGFDLKTVIAKVYERDASRIVMPQALQNEERYDFVLVPHHNMDPPAMRHLLQEAIERHFHVSAAIESRPADVYVMTALEGKTPPAKTGDDRMGGGSIGWSSQEFAVDGPRDGGQPTPEMIRERLATLKLAAMANISAFNTDLADFRRALEDGLGRPIIDESNLDGTYDLVVHGNARSTEEFLGMLRDQLGIVLTPERRNIEMLVIRLLP
uniref:Redoxin domain protein n=1 Tax=Solibacter usitatus (strain Ellin6076) TaxID=234267 RepID=Q01YH1_SOLUE